MFKRKIIIKLCLFGREFSLDLSYFRDNWGAVFVVVFQLLLVCCAVLLARGYDVAANELAVYAYYSLVLGVLLQFVSFLRSGGEEGE